MELTQSRLLRPILAFVTLSLAAFLLAPTVASVHARVNDLHFDRATPWEIFKWTDEPTPGTPMPDCTSKNRHMYSEITQWPAKIQKDEAFTLRGVVQSEEDGREGIERAKVDVFLNETKEEPGVFLGEAETGPGGFFSLMGLMPYDMPAQRYHIVAHAKQMRIDCSTYYEHWSDPEMDVLSISDIRFEPVEDAVVGREFNVRGMLVDAVGAPIHGSNITLSVNGKTHRITTEADGTFLVNHTTTKEGEVKFTASYRGGAYYQGSENSTIVRVASEAFVLENGSDLSFLRSEPLTLTGHLYVAKSAQKDSFLMTFRGAKFSTCATCEPSDAIRVPLEDDGTFSIALNATADQKGGNGTFSVTDGGLQEAYRYNFTITVPTTLEYKVDNAGFFSKRYHAAARLLDETGAPVNGTIALEGPEGWSTNQTDDKGIARFEGAASCGEYPTRASYNGTGATRGASAESTVVICGWMAFVPAWVLATPLWVWPTLLLLALAGFYLWRSLRQTYASTILTGPKLSLQITEPSDEAEGYAGLRERVVLTAFLEEPLPDGHTLRMGTPRSMQERPLDAALRASLEIVPEKLGDLALRAEIADAKGRVVTRRTVTLHVVKYAREIEKRYLELRATTGAKESVTPREFERWLRERAPGLEPEVARRLILVFEEADYSPREAGRAEFRAYLAAEKLHLAAQEVTPHARVA